jgi:hypothetical protein
MIDCRYYRSKIQKSLTDGSITLMKMRPKVSIDSIDRYYRYRSIADCAHLCITPTKQYFTSFSFHVTSSKKHFPEITSDPLGSVGVINELYKIIILSWGWQPVLSAKTAKRASIIGKDSILENNPEKSI